MNVDSKYHTENLKEELMEQTYSIHEADHIWVTYSRENRRRSNTNMESEWRKFLETSGQTHQRITHNNYIYLGGKNAESCNVYNITSNTDPNKFWPTRDPPLRNSFWKYVLLKTTQNTFLNTDLYKGEIISKYYFLINF